MAKVAVLNCPSCGAPLPADSPKCDLCGPRVETSDDRTKVVPAGIACPKCRWDNEPTRLFCEKCGADLMQKCHNCGETNPIGLQHCGACEIELSEARRLAVEKLVQEAGRNGLNNPSMIHPEYAQLYKQVASADETPIIFIGTFHLDAVLRHYELDQIWTTVFVATDHSFMFLEPEKVSFLWWDGREAVGRRIPFEDVKSLTLAAGGHQLVIKFDGGEAWVRLVGQTKQRGPRSHVPGRKGQRDGWEYRVDASRIINYFKPFLPLRLQQGW